jgi:hypothetical protein
VKSLSSTSRIEQQKHNPQKDEKENRPYGELQLCRFQDSIAVSL